MMEKSVKEWLENPIVELEPPFVDERGEIIPLFNNLTTNSAILVTSKKGSIRANHYHKTDWHYCYVVSGIIDYFHREVGDAAAPRKVRITAGQMFYTPPMVEHTMCFAEDTVFVCFGYNSRRQDDYESDLVRVELVKNYQPEA